jgi:hypothetical protein
METLTTQYVVSGSQGKYIMENESEEIEEAS